LSEVDFRWNYISECPSSGGFVKNNSNTASGIRIYGNIFRDGYPVNCNTGTCPDWRIFNNTFAATAGPVGGDGTRTGWYVYNNIVFGQSTSSMPAANGYNLFSQTTGNSCSMNAGPGENVTTRMPNNCDLIIVVPDPFVNSSGDLPEDFRLTAALAGWSGYNVGLLDAITGEKKYALDIYGNARGADGVWDRGAVEYTSTGVSNYDLRTSNVERRHAGEISNWLNPVRSLGMLRALVGPGEIIYDLRGNAVDTKTLGPGGVYLVKDQKTGAIMRAMVVR
jgi:hypothetical protein